MSDGTKWAIRVSDHHLKPYWATGSCGEREEFANRYDGWKRTWHWRSQEDGLDYFLVRITPRRPSRDEEERIKEATEKALEVANASADDWHSRYAHACERFEQMLGERDSANKNLNAAREERSNWQRAFDALVEKHQEQTDELISVEKERDAARAALAVANADRDSTKKSLDHHLYHCPKRTQEAVHTAARMAFAAAYEDVNSRYEPQAPHKHGTVSMDHRDWLYARICELRPAPVEAK
jgi:hypothetical protein